MESTRIDVLVAQVVAWHNRNRLARRITTENVRSVGVVVLPFVATDAASTSKPTGPVPAFSEDFIAPLTPKQVAAFALKDGSAEHPGTAAWPQRMVPADAGHESAELRLMFVRTASVELGDHRCRVLIGSGPRPKIIGPRAWSVPRIASLSAALTAVLASVATAMVLLTSTPAPPEAMAAAAPAKASVPASAPERVSAASAASGPASVPLAASAPEATMAASSARSSQAAVSGGHATPAEAGPSSAVLAAAPASPASKPIPKPAAAANAGRSPTAPRIRPELSGEMRAMALLEGQRLRAMAPPAGSSASAPVASEHVYAVMTMTTRTRALAERGHLLMESSASAGELPGKPRSELMQVSDGWRAVLWPFSSRNDAKVAQAMLSERGVRTQVLEF